MPQRQLPIRLPVLPVVIVIITAAAAAFPITIVPPPPNPMLLPHAPNIPIQGMKRQCPRRHGTHHPVAGAAVCLAPRERRRRRAG